MTGEPIRTRVIEVLTIGEARARLDEIEQSRGAEDSVVMIIGVRKRDVPNVLLNAAAKLRQIQAEQAD